MVLPVYGYMENEWMNLPNDIGKQCHIPAWLINVKLEITGLPIKQCKSKMELQITG